MESASIIDLLPAEPTEEDAGSQEALGRHFIFTILVKLKIISLF